MRTFFRLSLYIFLSYSHWRIRMTWCGVIQYAQSDWFCSCHTMVRTCPFRIGSFLVQLALTPHVTQLSEPKQIGVTSLIMIGWTLMRWGYDILFRYRGSLEFSIGLTCVCWQLLKPPANCSSVGVHARKHSRATTNWIRRQLRTNYRDLPIIAHIEFSVVEGPHKLIVHHITLTNISTVYNE